MSGLMNRRDLLAGAATLLGNAFLPPFLKLAGTSQWGAIVGVAETHQFIVDQACRLLLQDPVAQRHVFPTVSEIQSRDFVQRGQPSPGPDASGNSDYSWHYYNPKTLKGNAPGMVAEYFRRMMVQRLSGGDQTWGAAWSAHFLADMFVPYHTTGMPLTEAIDRNHRRDYVLDNDLCGDWRFMYSLTELPPPGWGLQHDHSVNLQRFCGRFWPGNPERADWFDPWYWNGYRTGWDMSEILSGSHALWEGLAAPALRFNSHMERLQGESWYDPLWINRKPAFEREFWNNQLDAIRTYTTGCAWRTRDMAYDILASPAMGIAMAVRAVLTLYRASMSALYITPSMQALPQGGYRVTANVRNTSPSDEAAVVDVGLRLRGQEEAGPSVVRVNGPIPPNETRSVAWNLPPGAPTMGTFEASGHFRGPDMGYTSTLFSTLSLIHI